jgi:methyl-accepting chemotaxis protein
MATIVERMSNMRVWIKLTLSIWLLLLISWPTLIIWQGYVSRQEAIDQAKTSSASVHEATLIGLTSMMVTGTVAQRDVLLDQFKQLPTVKDLRIIRAEPVIKLFGPGIGTESKPNDIEKGVLTTGVEFSDVQSDGNGEYLRIVRPVIGRTNYLGKNCLVCHLVPDGTMLGVVSMRVPLGRVNEIFLYHTLKSIGLATLVAFVLLGFNYIFVRNVVTRPLGNIVTELESIAKGEGDLTRRLEVRCRDEIGFVAEAFNSFMDKLQSIISDVKSGAEQVLRTTDDLAVVSERVAANSLQASQEAYSMATQVEIMTYTLEALASQAEDVQRASAESGEYSKHGSDIIHAAADEMVHIATTVNESSRLIQDLGQQSAQISQIVNVIKEIADQTNLLALNAAIEAARAGEQGRGFAVVADEVRKLAERTSISTKEITAMIDKIQTCTRMAIQSMDAGVTRVGAGAALAQQAGDAINQIKDGVEHVVSAVNEISASLKEQALSNSENAHKVESIASLSETNSNAFNETAKTVKYIDELARNLSNLVGRFRS